MEVFNFEVVLGCTVKNTVMYIGIVQKDNNTYLRKLVIKPGSFLV